MITKYSKEVEGQMRLHAQNLPEKTRRHYWAIEALKLGHGGQTYIANTFKVDRKTLYRAKLELKSEAPELAKGRQRKVGGGRKKTSTSTPSI